MRVDIELPDWVNDKHLYIMAGIELVAYKFLNDPWKIKTGRCNMCGKCCMNLGEVKERPLVKNGVCVFLKPDGDKFVCSLSSARPWSCCVGATLKNISGCTETFKNVC